MDLIRLRRFLTTTKDFHLQHPENRSLRWCYVLEATEDWVKNTEEWPANTRKRKKQEEEARQGNHQTNGDKSSDKVQQEHEWRKQEGKNTKHHDAYAGDGKQIGTKEEKTEYHKLLEKYTPQETALLRALQHKKDYIVGLGQNDGK